MKQGCPCKPNLAIYFYFSEICCPCPPTWLVCVAQLVTGESFSMDLNLFLGQRSNSALWLRARRESVTRSRSTSVTSQRLVSIHLPHTHISNLRIWLICCKHITPAVKTGAEFRSWRFTLLLCDFIRQQANKLQWRLNATKAPVKPATTREEFIPFQQLMNICSALVVTGLWSSGYITGLSW